MIRNTIIAIMVMLLVSSCALVSKSVAKNDIDYSSPQFMASWIEQPLDISKKKTLARIKKYGNFKYGHSDEASEFYMCKKNCDDFIVELVVVFTNDTTYAFSYSQLYTNESLWEQKAEQFGKYFIDLPISENKAGYYELNGGGMAVIIYDDHTYIYAMFIDTEQYLRLQLLKTLNAK